MEILLDALIDTMHLIPFLYLVYLIIGYLEKNTDNKLYAKMTNSRWGGPILGALLGCIPQCGFSVVGANLYSKKMIGVGTLLAIFISTSDEAIPILLAHPEMIGTAGMVLIFKVVLAVFIGLGIEAYIYLVRGRKLVGDTNGIVVDVEMVEPTGGCSCGCEGHNKTSNLWISALNHTIKILIFIFAINLILNIIIEGIGIESLESVLLTNSVFQPALAALIGMIPNCASSILLTEMYVVGSLSLGSLIAGLCTGAGMGLVILFKANKNTMDNLKILGILYLIGTLCGMVIQYIG